MLEIVIQLYMSRIQESSNIELELVTLNTPMPPKSSVRLTALGSQQCKVFVVAPDKAFVQVQLDVHPSHKYKSSISQSRSPIILCWGPSSLCGLYQRWLISMSMRGEKGAEPQSLERQSIQLLLDWTVSFAPSNSRILVDACFASVR